MRMKSPRPEEPEDQAIRWAYDIACAATGVASNNRAHVAELSRHKWAIAPRHQQAAIDHVAALKTRPDVSRIAGFRRIMGGMPAYNAVVGLEAFERLSAGISVAERTRLAETMLPFSCALLVFHTSYAWTLLNTNSEIESNREVLRLLGVGMPGPELGYKFVWKTETDWLCRLIVGVGTTVEIPETIDRAGLDVAKARGQLRGASLKQTFPARLADLEALSADCWKFLIAARGWAMANIDHVPIAQC
ncbi:hypothetical protein N825_10975 [Skermanella stibiiresistens SB22]|uniref:Uncharacterized protein n=1 Tax=Skermanella stibiiresistens SB22 TaxID=1385369 RepID=W9GXZ7_9PROT|nr:hypothetical protein [Skermanella stibiiresistens]EWY38800.1 hypothetical protein N825_10975 [Skermanella stibiiresistens SB22]